MKKLLAAAMAVFMALATAGCGNTADEQTIEDITKKITTASETELPETSAIEEASKTASETVTEIPETVSGTEEMTVESEAEETEAEETDNERRNVENKDLIGVWTADGGIIIFDEDNRVTLCFLSIILPLKYTLNDSKLIIEREDTEEYRLESDLAISDETLYLDSDAFDAFYRYEQKDVSISDFDGEYMMFDSTMWDSDDMGQIGTVVIDNGTGTSDEFDLKLSLNGNKVSLDLEGETAEYSYYFIENDEFEMCFIYLISDEKYITFAKDIND